MKNLKMVAFKLPTDIDEKLKRTAKSERRTQTSIIILALEGYFSKRAKSTKTDPIIEAHK